jgi:hypothetical protein
MNRLLLLILLLPMYLRASTPGPGTWMVWFGTQYVKKRVLLHTEMQYRTYRFPDNIEQVLARTGIGFDHASGKAHAVAGFCFVYAEPYAADGSRFSLREYRPFQQALFRHSSGRLQFIHRLRLEQRFVSDTYSDRFRYFLSLNYLVNKNTFEKNTFYLSAYNEVFLQSRKASLFDRNRIYGALGWVPKKGLRAELGYMIQMLATGSRQQLMLVLFQQMNFYKD